MIPVTSSQAEKTLAENADRHLEVVGTSPASQAGTDQYTQGQQDWEVLHLRAFTGLQTTLYMFYKWGHSPREPDTSVRWGSGGF